MITYTGDLMNIKSFIGDYVNCPLCQAPIKTIFNSKDKEIILENDILNIKFDIMNRTSIIKISYNFNINTNEFYVDFYDKKGNIQNKVSLSQLKAVKNYNDNMQFYNMYRNCDYCGCYNKLSQEFKMNFENNIIDLEIYLESFYIYYDDKQKSCKLTNYYESNESEIRFKSNLMGKNLSDMKQSIFTTPMIPFVDTKSTLARIEKLFLFK